MRFQAFKFVYPIVVLASKAFERGRDERRRTISRTLHDMLDNICFCVKIERMNTTLSAEEVQEYRKDISKLSNSGEFKKAYTRARNLEKKHPKVLVFAYLEAVLSAEGEDGFSKAQIKIRHHRASRKLKNILTRLRSASPAFRHSVRNEYYWFSHQPYKQYLLGCSQISAGLNSAYYSQGVGAAELARLYALQGRTSLSMRWAKRSEAAWLKYFKAVPDWANSYLFYAMALGCQGRTLEMELALDRSAFIAGKAARWGPIKKMRCKIKAAQKTLGYI